MTKTAKDIANILIGSYKHLKTNRYLQSYWHADSCRANVYVRSWLHLLPLDKNTQKVENEQLYRHAHSRCSASWPILIAKVKTLIRGLRLGFDLSPQGQCMPRSYHVLCLPPLMLLAQAVFLLQRRKTDKHRRDWTPVPPRRRLYSRHRNNSLLN